MLNVDIDLVLLCHNIFYFVYFSSGYIYQQQFYKNIIMQTKTKSSCEYWSKTMTQITVNELRICLMWTLASLVCLFTEDSKKGSAG